MTIGRTNTSGWSTNATLQSAQINAMDVAISTSLDRTSAGDTLSGRVVLAGAGRIVGVVATATDTNMGLAVGTYGEVRVTSAVTADRTFTLSSTGAVAGDILAIWCDATFAKTITVNDQSATALTTLTGAVVTRAEFYWTGSTWLLHSQSSPRANNTQAFTASGTWTCPLGVTSVLLTGCGGGGGGGGGKGNGGAGSSFYGGGGGGGAVPRTTTVPVTAGTTYTVTIGAGGAGGNGGVGSSGLPGGDTTFGSLAVFRGAAGGTVGDITGGTTTFGGSPYNLITSTANAVLPGQGGGNASSGLASLSGGGIPGTPGFGAFAGGGGGASIGNGGNGGTTVSVGTAGTLGAGGGAGGGAGSGANGAIGGAGGSGYLRVDWTR